MILENKKFVIKKKNVKAIEDFIKSKGYKPVRWAIIKAENGNFTIEATTLTH